MPKPSPLPASADVPLEIRYSVRKMLTSWEMVFSLLILISSINVVRELIRGPWEAEGFWPLLGLGAALIALGAIAAALAFLCILMIGSYVIPLITIVRRPGRLALTISKEGLTFTGGPLIPWRQIEENDWLGSGVRTKLLVKARSPEGPLLIVRKSRFFKCSREQYLRYCDFYRAASAVPQT